MKQKTCLDKARWAGLREFPVGDWKGEMDVRHTDLNANIHGSNPLARERQLKKRISLGARPEAFAVRVFHSTSVLLAGMRGTQNFAPPQ